MKLWQFFEKMSYFLIKYAKLDTFRWYSQSLPTDQAIICNSSYILRGKMPDFVQIFGNLKFEDEQSQGKKTDKW